MAGKRVFDPRPAVTPAGWAVAVSFTVLLSGAGSYEVSSPPSANLHRDLAILGGFAALIFALVTSRKDLAGGERRLAGIAILLAMGGLWVLFGNYLANHSTYPMTLVVLAGLLCTVVASGRGQRVVAIAMTGFYVLWLGPGHLPARNSLPLVARSGEFSAELQTRDSDGGVELRGPPGRELASAVDLERIKLGAMIGPLVALYPKYSWTVPSDLPNDTALLSSHLHAPAWARSWSLRLEVPVWPAVAAVSFEIPIEALTGTGLPRAFSGHKGELGLTVTDVRLTETTHRLPALPCIALTATTEGLPYSGFRGNELRITDQDGHALEWVTGSSMGSESGSTRSIEVAPIPEGLRTLRIDFYSDEQTRESKIVFDFPSVPTRGSP